MSQLPDGLRRILVVRLSAGGDVVFASPLARALRRRYPDAHIAWAAEERTADLIRHNPYLDEVIVWERAAWRQMLRQWRLCKLARAVKGFIHALRSRRFDLVIDVHGLLRSGTVAFLTGAPIRIGMGSREGSRLLMTRVVPRGGKEREISSEYAYLATILGLDTTSFPMEIPRSPAEMNSARALLKNTQAGEKFIVVCPFTTRPYKHWREEHWSLLIQLLRERTGLAVVLLGASTDRAAADRILADVSVPVADLVGKTTLGEASAVVSLCATLVGVDTGLSHMAHAHSCPAVLLFGAHTPYLDPPTQFATILHSGRACSPCRGKLTCDGRVDCMTDLSVEMVLNAVEARLGST